MAELEVAKNMKKAVDIAQSKEHSLWHKMKEIAMEILIIVFAVSLSISLHSWSEHREHQHETQIFLKGLKLDLQKDITEMKIDIQAYKKQQKIFAYISSIPDGKIANKDSIEKNKSYLFSFTGIGKTNGRYEGMKTSGRLQYIENDELQNSILDLYEENVPLLKISTDYYKIQKVKLTDYLIDNTQGYPNGNFLTMISKNNVKNRTGIYLSSVDHIINQYQECIAKSEKIIELIEDEKIH
jgi:hypothetical protein